jgi:hypothetical protein
LLRFHSLMLASYAAFAGLRRAIPHAATPADADITPPLMIIFVFHAATLAMPAISSHYASRHDAIIFAAFIFHADSLIFAFLMPWLSPAILRFFIASFRRQRRCQRYAFLSPMPLCIDAERRCLRTLSAPIVADSQLFAERHSSSPFRRAD